MKADLIHITKLTHRPIEDLLQGTLSQTVVLKEVGRENLGEIGGIPVVKVDYDFVVEQRKRSGASRLSIRTRSILDLD